MPLFTEFKKIQKHLEAVAQEVEKLTKTQPPPQEQIEKLMQEGRAGQNRAREIRVRFRHFWNKAMGFYLEAYDFMPRPEPLVRIAVHYNDTRAWQSAYLFLHKACEFTIDEMKSRPGVKDLPESELCIDNRVWNFERWFQLAIISWYAHEFERGKEVAQIAVANAPDDHMRDLANGNLEFYGKI